MLALDVAAGPALMALDVARALVGAARFAGTLCAHAVLPPHLLRLQIKGANCDHALFPSRSLF